MIKNMARIEHLLKDDFSSFDMSDVPTPHVPRRPFAVSDEYREHVRPPPSFLFYPLH